MKRFNTYLIEKLKVSAKTLDIDAFNDEFNEFLDKETTWYFTTIFSSRNKLYTVIKEVNVSEILNSIYNTIGAKYTIRLKLNFDEKVINELTFNSCKLDIFKDSRKISEIELVFPTEFNNEFFNINILLNYLHKEFKNFIAEFLYIENTEDFYKLLKDIYILKNAHPKMRKYKIKFL